MRTTQLRGRQGFTLIELLVVIAIIAILASMVIPAIGLAQDNANTQASAKNMRGIVEVLITYTSDEGTWPAAASPDGSRGWANGAMSDDNKANAHLASIGAFGTMMLAILLPYPINSLHQRAATLPGQRVSQMRVMEVAMKRGDGRRVSAFPMGLIGLLLKFPLQIEFGLETVLIRILKNQKLSWFSEMGITSGWKWSRALAPCKMEPWITTPARQ